MRRSVPRWRMWVAALAPLSALLACAPEPDLDDAARAVAIASTRPGLIVVEARLESPDREKAGGRAPRLVIDRAAVAPGAPPRLLDDPRLGGRIELLNGAGETLWSLHYRPPAEAGETLRLRAPLVQGARTVRLSESARGLTAEAPLEP